MEMDIGSSVIAVTLAEANRPSLIPNDVSFISSCFAVTLLGATGRSPRPSQPMHPYYSISFLSFSLAVLIQLLTEQKKSPVRLPSTRVHMFVFPEVFVRSCCSVCCQSVRAAGQLSQCGGTKHHTGLSVLALLAWTW